MRTQHLAQNMDRPHHLSKGVAKSNNQRRRCNKFPGEEPVSNHNITGTSKIRAKKTYTNTVSPTKPFCQPNNAHELINETDTHGIPNYWSMDGQLVLSPQGFVRCNYYGVPSHSQDICKIRTQDKMEGRYYTVHPNRGHILSNNQAAKQLQPAGGASYEIFKIIKRHLRYEKDRAQLLKARSQQVIEGNKATTNWDRNHNNHPNDQYHPVKPASSPKVKAQPEIVSPGKLTKHRAKWASEETITEIAQENQTGLVNMPSEILEQIIAYLPFKQRIRIQRTNQRIMEVTLNPKLITIRDHQIKNSIMRSILKAKTTSLDIPNCTWRITPREEIEMENYLILYEPKLTYLGLQGYGGNNAIIATTIFLAKNLTTLDLSEASFDLLCCVLNRLNRTNLITSVNLSTMKKSLLR